MCRKIKEEYPECANYRLEVVSPSGDVQFAVPDIGVLADKSFAENVNGIKVVKYVAFPGAGSQGFRFQKRVGYEE